MQPMILWREGGGKGMVGGGRGVAGGGGGGGGEEGGSNVFWSLYIYEIHSTLLKGEGVGGWD